MVISKEEAVQALSEIDSAKRRTHSMQFYRHLAPHLVLWGFIWLVANCTTELYPQNSAAVWNGLTWAGVITSMLIGYRSKHHHADKSISQTSASKERGLRILGTSLVVLGFFISVFTILPQLNPKQINAFISLFWGAYYAVVGIWTGVRMLIVGVLITLSILVAYFVIPDHYFLWMGLVTGSLLILGGAWLRRV